MVDTYEQTVVTALATDWATGTVAKPTLQEASDLSSDIEPGTLGYIVIDLQGRSFPESSINQKKVAANLEFKALIYTNSPSLRTLLVTETMRVLAKNGYILTREDGYGKNEHLDTKFDSIISFYKKTLLTIW
jgi:hypothetical protein